MMNPLTTIEFNVIFDVFKNPGKLLEEHRELYQNEDIIMKYFLTRVYREGNEILMVAKINKQLDEDVAIYKSESGFHLIDMASGLSIVNTKYLSDPSRSHIRKVLIDYYTDRREELRASLLRLRTGRNMSTQIQKDGYWISKYIPSYTNSWRDYSWDHVQKVLESMQDELEKLGEGSIYAKIGKR